MPSPRKIKEQIEQGNYSLVDPLDFIIIGFLPDEGSLFMGLYPNGELVPNLLKKFTSEQRKAINSTMLSARLRVLHLMGLVVPKERGVSAGGKFVWQRTAKGAEQLQEWKKKGGKNGNTDVG